MAAKGILCCVDPGQEGLSDDRKAAQFRWIWTPQGYDFEALLSRLRGSHVVAYRFQFAVRISTGPSQPLTFPTRARYEGIFTHKIFRREIRSYYHRLFQIALTDLRGLWFETNTIVRSPVDCDIEFSRRTAHSGTAI